MVKLPHDRGAFAVGPEALWLVPLPALTELLDQFVSTGEQRGRHRQPERLCRLKIDN